MGTMFKLGIKGVKWTCIGVGATVIGMYFASKWSGQPAEITFGKKTEI